MIVIYADGAAEPTNTGYGAGGWCIDGEETEGVVDLGWGVTNNVAEYEAIKAALDHLVAAGRVSDSVVVHSDSQLAVNQINGDWQINKENLAKLVAEIRTLSLGFRMGVSFRWIPREKNARADALSKRIYAEKGIRVRREGYQGHRKEETMRLSGGKIMKLVGVGKDD